MLCYFVQTDGHSISLQFDRKKQEEYIKETPLLSLEDFDTTAEIEGHFLPSAIDPARKQVFTACIGNILEKNKTRRSSDIERRCYAGSTRRQAYVDKLKISKNVKGIETNIPKNKPPTLILSKHT